MHNYGLIRSKSKKIYRHSSFNRKLFSLQGMFLFTVNIIERDAQYLSRE